MFDNYPQSLLVHPQSDPQELIRHLGRMGGVPPIHAAQACVANKAWQHLHAMVAAGYDLSESHIIGGDEDGRTDETLLHRCLRLHLHNDLATRLDNLLALGASPHKCNGQGLTVLGLLCLQSKDLPAHRTQEAYAVLKQYGVRMSSPCSNNQGLSRYLLPSHKAPLVIKDRCPELAGWARACWREENLEARLPSTSSVSARRF